VAKRLSSPVLVGRDSELALLASVTAGADAGRPATVALGGEPGIGKTRLVSEFMAQARAAGATVLAGSCVDLGGGRGLPYAPIAGLLRDLVRAIPAAEVSTILGPALAELTALVPDLPGASEMVGPIPRPSAGAYGQARLFERLLGVLERLGRRSVSVLVLEDVHWIDDASASLLMFLARNLRTERVLLLLTFRSDELA
jgi:predicted ATPase